MVQILLVKGGALKDYNVIAHSERLVIRKTEGTFSDSRIILIPDLDPLYPSVDWNDLDSILLIRTGVEMLSFCIFIISCANVGI